MPCSCEGYPEPPREIKDPYEAVKTLHEHHIIVEKELEELRIVCKQQEEAIKKVLELFPGLVLPHINKAPTQSNNWTMYK